MPNKVYDDEKQDTENPNYYGGKHGGSHERAPVSDKKRGGDIAEREKDFEGSGAPEIEHGKDRDGGLNDSPGSLQEKDFYNSESRPRKSPRTANIGTAFKVASNYKKAAALGGVASILAAVGMFFSFLGTFQLTHWTEFADNVTGAQTRRIVGSRAADHYILAADGLYFRKTGLGRIATGYGALNPETVRNDLRKKGWDISLNEDGRVVLSRYEFVDGRHMLYQVDSDDANLSNKQMRSKISELFEDVYKQEGFLKRSMRSRTAFKSMGIQRVFFETPRQAVADWQLEMIKRIRSRLSLVNDPNLRASGIDEDAQRQADDIAEKIDDPNYDPGAPGNMPDISTTPNVSRTTVSSLTKGTQLDGVAQAACEAVAYSDGVLLAAKATRYATLIANMGMIYVMAHQIKTGEQVTASQVSAVMTIMNRKPGVGASGSYRQMSGEKDAKVKYSEELGMSFTGAGGVLSTVVAEAKAFLSKIQVGSVDGNDYCRVSRNPFYQVGSVVVGGTAMVGSAILTGGVSLSAVAVKFGTSIASSVSWETAKALARPYLARALVGGAAMLHYGPSQGGDKTFDAMAGGALAIATSTRYQNGMTQRLTFSQRASIEKAIALENNEKLKNQSIFQKYFALDNINSSLSRQLSGMPSTPQDTAIGISKNIASLPYKLVNSVSLLTPHGVAKATVTEGNPYVINNPLDLPFYGLTDEKVEEMSTKYKIVDNEEWIYNSEEGIEGYKQWVNECYPSNNPLLLHGLPTTTDEESLINDKCSNLDEEKYARYATYRFDRNIQQSILFMSKTSDCTDPDSEDPFCTDVEPGSITTPVVNTVSNVGSGSQCVTTGIDEPPADYTRTTWSGKTINERTRVMLEQSQNIIRKTYPDFSLVVTQGSYGGIAASNGSHDGGGAVDIGGNSNGFTGNMQKAEVIAKAMRMAGFAAWVRTPENSGFTWHIHANALGDADSESNETVQWMIDQYFKGGNGLSSSVSDPHLPTIGRPIPEWALKLPGASAACPSLVAV